MPAFHGQRIRKLQALARRGVLERIDSGLYTLPDRVVNSAPVLRAADASRKRIWRSGSFGRLVATALALGFLPFFLGFPVLCFLR